MIASVYAQPSVHLSSFFHSTWTAVASVCEGVVCRFHCWWSPPPCLPCPHTGWDTQHGPTPDFKGNSSNSSLLERSPTGRSRGGKLTELDWTHHGSQRPPPTVTASESKPGRTPCRVTSAVVVALVLGKRRDKKPRSHTPSPTPRPAKTGREHGTCDEGAHSCAVGECALVHPGSLHTQQMSSEALGPKWAHEDREGPDP